MSLYNGGYAKTRGVQGGVQRGAGANRSRETFFVILLAIHARRGRRSARLPP